MARAEPFTRPRVSPETRRLLGAAAMALVVLWGLARLRYPDTPVAATPVPPFLAQLSAPVRFADLAGDLAAIAAQIRSSVMVVPLHGDDGLRPRLALHVRPGVAVAVIMRTHADNLSVRAEALRTDRPTGLTLVATQRTDAISMPKAWQPDPRSAPRFLMAAIPAPGDMVGIRPVLVSTWFRQRSAAWNGDVWTIDASPPVTPGMFLFTPVGELAGVVINDGGGVGLVGSPTLYAAIDAFSNASAPTEPGWLGLSATTLTPRLAAAARVDSGVLLLSVDRNGPAQGVLTAGDVVTAVNDIAITSLEEWSAIVDRAGAGDLFRLRLSDSRGLEITASRVPAPPLPTLGARLRRATSGIEITAVDPGSRTEAAGLRTGDVITRVDKIDRPQPADLRRAFSAGVDAPVLILFSRGGVTHAAALEPR